MRTMSCYGYRRAGLIALALLAAVLACEQAAAQDSEGLAPRGRRYGAAAPLAFATFDGLSPRRIELALGFDRITTAESDIASLAYQQGIGLRLEYSPELSDLLDVELACGALWIKYHSDPGSGGAGKAASAARYVPLGLGLGIEAPVAPLASIHASLVPQLWIKVGDDSDEGFEAPNLPFALEIAAGARLRLLPGFKLSLELGYEFVPELELTGFGVRVMGIAELPF